MGLPDDGVIRISLDEGLAGWVALRGQMVNIKNAYEDVRFNPSFDATIGYKTRSLMAAPLHDKSGKVTKSYSCLFHFSTINWCE